MTSSTDTTDGGTTTGGRRKRAATAAAGDATTTAEAGDGRARRTATAYVAYKADLSKVYVFTREGEAAMYAIRNGLRVAPVRNGDEIRDAIGRQQALENGGGTE